jgi:hypothetical protein
LSKVPQEEHMSLRRKLWFGFYILLFCFWFVEACVIFGTFNVFLVIGKLLGDIVIFIGVVSLALGIGGILLLAYALTITYGPICKFADRRPSFREMFRS